MKRVQGGWSAFLTWLAVSRRRAWARAGAATSPAPRGARPCLWRKAALLSCLTVLAGPAFAADATATATAGRSGAWVYGTKCGGCHTSGLRGAPRVSDRAAWAPRLAQGKDQLYAHTLQGKGWMPRRGGCTACSDQEVRDAVDHLLSVLK